MNNSYPLPAYAANIWARGQDLVLQFPPLASGDKTSQITFPMSPRGILLLLRILQERATAADLRIGNKATPCAAEILAAIASDDKFKAWMIGQKRSKAEMEAAEAELARLGL